MRTNTGWLAVVLAAGMALAPGMASAQDTGVGGGVPPMDPPLPLPLNAHLDRGGLFGAIEFLLLKQSRPIENQVIAVRGVFDSDGQITGHPGMFLGSGRVALRADDLGPLTYAPGISVVLGYRFRNGVEAEVSWWHTFTARYAGGASLVPFNFLTPGDLSDTFLTASVFNFSPDYAGPLFKSPTLSTRPGEFYGIWNGADTMDIQFLQRFDQYDVTVRMPIFQTDSDRCYGLLGGRFAWIWEKFKWTTVDRGFKTEPPPPSLFQDPFTGQLIGPITLTRSPLIPDAGPEDEAIYTNIVSNRMYGPFIGIGNEYYLGHGFSISLDLKAALLLDVVKERAKYERGDFATEAKRSKTDFTVVPEVQGQLNLWWYPIEGVAIRLGYNAFAFFNTIGAEKPVAFNFGALDPPWEHQFFRFFDGVNVGISFVF